MLSEEIKKELRGIVGKTSVSFEREDVLCYSFDATGKSSLPDGVIFPKTTQEVSLILKLANDEVFPVIARGAGTGFTGGSVPVEGGLVLSLEEMASIVDIDTENLTAEVEPGVVTGDFADAVESKGLFYPPDPSSLKFSTIGGNVAECAGGPRAVKYGVTRDYVLGLEAVLPNGDIIDTGVKKTLKGVVGYDLTRLIVGSEGTLAVVTKVYLKLLPLPETRTTMLVKFKDLPSAAKTVSSIVAGKMCPSALELIDESSLRCVEESEELGLTGVAAVLLIEVDGSAEVVEDGVKAIEEICRENGSAEFRVATDKYETKDLWRVRRAISPSLSKLKPTKINEDIVVPRSKLVELIEGLKKISDK
ncbi:MAG: FAD-binding protein, partial [Deltaproteobacteria bacterium]|nr:FAD-binding protein [Deltaproteobacteria bacterium]